MSEVAKTAEKTETTVEKKSGDVAAKGSDMLDTGVKVVAIVTGIAATGTLVWAMFRGDSGSAEKSGEAITTALNVFK